MQNLAGSRASGRARPWGAHHRDPSVTVRDRAGESGPAPVVLRALHVRVLVEDTRAGYWIVVSQNVTGRMTLRTAGRARPCRRRRCAASPLSLTTGRATARLDASARLRFARARARRSSRCRAHGSSDRLPRRPRPSSQWPTSRWGRHCAVSDRQRDDVQALIWISPGMAWSVPESGARRRSSTSASRGSPPTRRTASICRVRAISSATA